MSTSELYPLSDEVSLHVTSSGQQTPGKPTLIFLHFWGGSSHTFSRMTSLLLLPPHQYHSLAISFRGWGLSTGPASASAYSVRQLASDIETLLPRLLPDNQDFILIAHSMGGKVAQLIAGRRKFPGLRGLVLIAPAPPTPFELPPEMKAQQVSAYDSAESAEFVVRNVLTASEVDDEVVESLVQDMLRGNEFAKAAWPAYGMAESIVEEARMIRVPVLVLVGEKDVVEPRERVEREVVGNVGGAEAVVEVVVLEGKGHLLPVEAPGEVVRYVLEFVEKILKGEKD